MKWIKLVSIWLVLYGTFKLFLKNVKNICDVLLILKYYDGKWNGWKWF